MILYLIACSEYVIDADRSIEPVDTNTQPDENPAGSVPNWADCPTGYSGMYYNLPENHVDVEVDEAVPITNYEVLDWWSPEYLSFVRFDSSLDYGENWWPIDDGFSGDPSYFSVAWYFLVPHQFGIKIVSLAPNKFCTTCLGSSLSLH